MIGPEAEIRMSSETPTKLGDCPTGRSGLPLLPQTLDQRSTRWKSSEQRLTYTNLRYDGQGCIKYLSDVSDKLTIISMSSGV